MKRLLNFITNRVEFPSVADLIIGTLFTLFWVQISTEIVSREFNSYFQASMMLASLYLIIISLKMWSTWIYHKFFQ